MGIGVCGGCKFYDHCVSMYAVRNEMYYEDAEDDILERKYPCDDYEEKDDEINV